ncbi:hypothetical protein ACLB2K_051706 [Fragaria x ananassa]
MAAQGVVSVFSKVNDDILQNILGRLPAVAFACSACVSKTWNRNCSSILCRPMFVSAMSVNPDACEAADEVWIRVDTSCVDTSPFTVLLSIWLVSLPPEPVEAPVLWFFDSLQML